MSLVPHVLFANDKASESSSFSRPLRWRQDGVDFIEIQFKSQRFKGQDWVHLLLLAKPLTPLKAKTALLNIAGGSSLASLTHDKPLASPEDRGHLARLAQASGMLVGTLFQIPFQPIFDGKKEDEAISYSFTQFFETGDPTWPLLVPMTTAVRKGLDTFDRLAQETWAIKPMGYVLSGISKRAWTTWLAAAQDHRERRIKAIVPEVFDMLNIPKQLDHQLKSWGTYSPEIGDYSKKGLPQALASPRGKKLLEVIDPFWHRQHITIPKVIVQGTNDTYWPVDGANLYVNDLVGPTYLDYHPNESHEITNRSGIDQNRIVLALAAEGEFSLPLVTSTLVNSPSDSKLLLTPPTALKALKVTCSELPFQVTLWQAQAPTTDFRKATWKSVKKIPPAKDLLIPLDHPKTGHLASFAQIVFKMKSHLFTVSSHLLITPPP